MSLDTFVQTILGRGKEEVDAILAQARSDGERILADIRTEGEKTLRDSEARAHGDAERKRVQELARADLEGRKIVLAAQKEALDEVYRRALSRLGTLKENTRILQALLKANESEWKAGGRVYSSERDAAFVKGLVGKAYAGAVDCQGGLVIENADGTRRVDLRYESVLRDVWNDSVREIAEILWPSRASKA